MKHKFFLQIENTPNVTGTVIPEVTRFDVYVAGEHDSHTDNEHTGFWGQIELPEPLPFAQDGFDAHPGGMAPLKEISEPAYWYATGLLDAAELMDDFDWNPNCEGCQKAVTS